MGCGTGIKPCAAAEFVPKKLLALDELALTELAHEFGTGLETLPRLGIKGLGSGRFSPRGRGTPRTTPVSGCCPALSLPSSVSNHCRELFLSGSQTRINLGQGGRKPCPPHLEHHKSPMLCSICPRSVGSRCCKTVLRSEHNVIHTSCPRAATSGTEKLSLRLAAATGRFGSDLVGLRVLRVRSRMAPLI